ncbi:MAG: carboxypeptidase regulatory-like domain-containing protein [Anaerolineae bacterium]|nr:MAG: carboxypeptidase regulatory-like domain-containing protein [Anaerolineae bacterium]
MSPLRSLSLFLTLLLLTACAPASDLESSVATSVAATQAAGASAVDAVGTSVAATIQAGSPVIDPAATTAPALGTVSGRVCYPSSGIPPMTLYLSDPAQAILISLDIAQNQSEYTTDVPPGSYTAFAWLPDFSYGGSYSQAVPCGLSVGCEDHSLIQFNVAAGASTTGIDVCDWYGAPDSVPLPPGVTVPNGAISGRLGYPSSYIPPLVIVATNVNTAQWFYITTPENTGEYTFTDLPPGEYTVIAYVAGDTNDYGGGYTIAVLCGLSVDCNDHSLISVIVTSGQTAPGADLTDWYAPPGTFPPNPVP